LDLSKNIKQKKPSKLSAFFICLLIATLLWLLHSLNTVYTKQFSIPVQFKNYPQNKLMIEVPKDIKVSVKASGLKLFMIGLTEPFPVLQMDLNDLKSDPTRSKFYLSSNLGEIKKMFQFKADIKRIQPDTLSFINNKGTQKEVPVKVPLTISYAKGYTAKLITLNPAKVMITGEAVDLEGIDTIYSTPLLLDDQQTDQLKTLNLINPNNKIAINATAVQLSISLGKLVEKEVTIPIKLENVDDRFKYSLFPSKVKVKYSGVFGELGADTTLFKIFVDLKQQKNNKLSVNIKLLSEQINILSFEPKEVEFLMIRK
jgi:YbbR domain-containing protein